MKMINFEKPYQLFVVAIGIIWLGVILTSAEAIDIQLHDTYFVIAYYHIALFFTIVFGGFSLGYWLFRKKPLIHWMTIFHTTITIMLLLIWFFWYGFPTNKNAAHYIEGDMILYQPIFYLILLLFFLLAQIFFVLNLLITLFKKHN